MTLKVTIKPAPLAAAILVVAFITIACLDSAHREEVAGLKKYASKWQMAAKAMRDSVVEANQYVGMYQADEMEIGAIRHALQKLGFRVKICSTNGEPNWAEIEAGSSSPVTTLRTFENLGTKP